jgi:hypothetical protein
VLSRPGTGSLAGPSEGTIIPLYAITYDPIVPIDLQPCSALIGPGATDRTRAAPGVKSAALASWAPVAGADDAGIVPEGATFARSVCRGQRHSQVQGQGAFGGHRLRVRSAVGIEFSEIEWEGAHATFYAEFVDLDRKSAGAHRPVAHYDGHANQVVIEGGIPGAGFPASIWSGARWHVRVES